MNLLLLTLSIVFTNNTAKPAEISVLDLTGKSKALGQKLITQINLLPNLNLASPAKFPKSDKSSIRKTLATLPDFPAKLARNILEKQLTNRKLEALLLLAHKKIYLLTGKALHGPFAYLPKNKSLPTALLTQLQKLNKNKLQKAKKMKPWYKSWLFWTGLTVISGTIAIITYANQEPDTVNIHINY
ncbi:MAG: hypothetical protein PF689_08590 [Deltaproteobacteria bacterium]|jgi:hypothetical protein|nr:hypothetical protein [Deltaproteobacteria bacterium]